MLVLGDFLFWLAVDFCAHVGKDPFMSDVTFRDRVSELFCAHVRTSEKDFLTIFYDFADVIDGHLGDRGRCTVSTHAYERGSNSPAQTSVRLSVMSDSVGGVDDHWWDFIISGGFVYSNDFDLGSPINTSEALEKFLTSLVVDVNFLRICRSILG